MKKIVAILSAILLIGVLFVGCEINSGTPKETTSSTENPTEPATEGITATEEVTEPQESTAGTTIPVTEPTVEVTEPVVEVTEPVTEPTEPVVVDPSVIDVSNARETTSAKDPAKLGEWIKSTRYSAVSRQYETIYWRIVGTTFDCQSDIDRYNGGNHIYEFTPLENEDLAYCKVIYQVYFPEEFSEAEWGISSPTLSLSGKNPNGGGIEWKGMAYIGLGSCYDITPESSETLHSGDVFTGESLFVMINDPSVEYVFEYYHPAEGVDGEILYDYANHK